MLPVIPEKPAMTYLEAACGCQLFLALAEDLAELTSSCPDEEQTGIRKEPGIRQEPRASTAGFHICNMLVGTLL